MCNDYIDPPVDRKDFNIQMGTICGIFAIILLLALALWFIGIKDKRPYHDNRKSAVIHIAVHTIGIFLFLFDISSDILMAVYYFSYGYIVEFSLTLIFILSPFIIIGSYNFFFDDQEWKGKPKEAVLLYWAMYVLTSVFNPLYAFTLSLAFGKGDETAMHLSHMASYYTMIEACLEATPQLVLQLYFVISTKCSSDVAFDRIYLYASIVASALEIAWSIISFKMTMQDMEDRSERWKSKLVLFLSRVGEVGPRLLILALFASVFHYVIAVFFVYRFLLCVLICSIALIKRDKTQDDENNPEFKYMETALAVLSNIYFFNGSKDRLHKNFNIGGKFYVIYYLVFYMENISLIGLWAYYTTDKHRWFYIASLAVFCVGTITHVILLRVYYWLRKRTVVSVININSKPETNREEAKC